MESNQYILNEKLDYNIEEKKKKVKKKVFIKIIKVKKMYGVEEPWCNNQGIAVLPYMRFKQILYFLVNLETNPLFLCNDFCECGNDPTCWKNVSHVLSTITGGGCGPIQVLKEIEEETGLKVFSNNKKDKYKPKLIFLNEIVANKNATKNWQLYCIELTNNDFIEPLYPWLPLKGKGDGSIGEKDNYAIWITEEQLQNVNDNFSMSIYGNMKLKGIL